MPDFSHEMQVIRSSIRRGLPGPETKLASEELPLDRVNWNTLLWLGRQSKVLPWVHSTLSAPEFSGTCPPAILEQLNALRQANQFRTLARGREICLIQDRFEKEGISAIYVDGWIFSQLCGKSPDLRECGANIRCLVRAKDQARANQVLTDAGYNLTPDPLRLNNREKSIVLFQSSLAPGNRLAAQGWERVWSAAGRTVAGGRSIPTLAPAHWLIYLCWKGGNNLWRNLRTIHDVVALWRMNPGWNEADLWKETEALGMTKSVVLGSAVSFRALGLPIPSSVAGRLPSHWGWAPMAKRAARRSTERGAFSLADRLRWRAGMQPDWDGKLRTAWRQVRNDFRPEASKLPEPGDELSYLGRFSPTPPIAAEGMLRLAGTGPNDVVIDMGCGNGNLVVAAAKVFGAKGIGMDIDPKRIEEAKAKAQAQGVADKTEFSIGDLIDADISGATVVCLYIQGFVYSRILEKLRRECRPGTRIVSHDFIFPGWPPEKSEVVRCSPGRVALIYLWRV